ncbi:hypothetical protein BJV78DRAFT_1299034 [Lactifluus subvellereus]|nr:hypothetical protein BJV78DRAFT_1299034 [Lactifluus subvellereus]
MDRNVEAIHVGHSNTVCTLQDQLAKVAAAGYADIGFPILRSDKDGRSHMLGFIGGNELEHALSIVAEEADHPMSFHLSHHLYRSLSSSSLLSILEHPEDPFDFSTPLTISINSPLELVQQFFIKLGAQYVVTTDADGYYEGLIDKNGWLTFLDELEMKAT